MLSGPRSTKRREGDIRNLPLAAGAVILQGSIAVMVAGFASKGQVANNLVSVGMALSTADNKDGANGAISVDVQSGCFAFVNSGTDPVDLSHVGKTVFIEDDETIAATDAGGTLSAAGTLFDFDGDAWVNLG